MKKLFGKKDKKKEEKEKKITPKGFGASSKSNQPIYDDDDSDEEVQTKPTRNSNNNNNNNKSEFSDYKPEFSINEKKNMGLPPGTGYLLLPEVGPEVVQEDFDLNEINDDLRVLKRKVTMLSELVDNNIFSTDEVKDSKKIEKEIEETLKLAAIIHKRVTTLPPGLDVNDFRPAEKDLYDSVSRELFTQLANINTIKTKYSDQQSKKLHKAMRIVHPDLTEQELEQKVDDAIMNDDDILADSSQMFAQQIIDDRYKREEAKIALMYAKEQKKELEQIERSIAQLHQMSVDLAALVQGQQEILNQMEASISNAVTDSVKGLKMLEVAESSRISARKKKIIIGVIIAVAIGVTVLTIAGITAGVICLMG